MKTLLMTMMAIGLWPAANAQTKQVTLQVHPLTAPCSGVGYGTCLQTRTASTKPWQLMYGGIEGFTHQPGFLYTLLIKETQVARPPADGSSIKRSLVKMISKIPAHMDNSLYQANWTISHLRKSGKMQDVLQRGYSIRFADSSLSAKLCNQFRGRFVAAADGTLKAGAMGSTRMACPQAADETAFAAAMAAAYTIVVKDGRLTLYNQQGQPLLQAEAVLQPAVAAPASVDYQALLDASRYEVQSLTDDAGTADVRNSGAFVKFDRANKRISGKGGCNNFFGTAELTFTSANAGRLQLGKMGSTMMACPQHMDTERRLLRLFEKVDSFEITSDGLLLLLQQGKTIVKLVNAS